MPDPRDTALSRGDESEGIVPLRGALPEIAARLRGDELTTHSEAMPKLEGLVTPPPELARRLIHTLDRAFPGGTLWEMLNPLAQEMVAEAARGVTSAAASSRQVIDDLTALSGWTFELRQCEPPGSQIT